MEKKYLFNTFSVPFQYLSMDKMSLFIQERGMSFSFFPSVFICPLVGLFLCSLVGLFFFFEGFYLFFSPYRAILVS